MYLNQTEEESMAIFEVNSTDGKGIIQNLNSRISKRLFPITILIGTEAIIGLVGNILILCVYSRFYKHCNFRYFVLYLAIYDLTSCLIALPGEMYLQSNWFNFKNNYICKIKSYFNVFTAWGSAFTLFLLACDRYRKVCKPLNAQMQPSQALKLCLTGVLLSFCVAAPDAVLWGKQSYTYEKGTYSLNLSICEKADKYKDEIYPFVYIISIYIVPLGIMAVTICTVNCLIARKMFCKMDLTPLTRRRTRSSRVTARQTVITIFGNKNKQTYYASSQSISIEELSDACVNPAIHEDSPAEDVNRMDTSHSSSSIELCVQQDLPEQNANFLHRENSQSVHSSSVTSHVRKTSSIQRTGRRTVTESSSDTALHRNAVSGLDSVRRTSRIRRIRRRTTTESSFDTALRRKRKTLIMLILTSVFVLTISIYIVLITIVADTRGKVDIMRQLDNDNIVVFLFFLRFYFINCIINPILYGLLDSRFRNGLKRIFCFALRH